MSSSSKEQESEGEEFFEESGSSFVSGDEIDGDAAEEVVEDGDGDGYDSRYDDSRGSSYYSGSGSGSYSDRGHGQADGDDYDSHGDGGHNDSQSRSQSNSHSRGSGSFDDETRSYSNRSGHDNQVDGDDGSRSYYSDEDRSRSNSQSRSRSQRSYHEEEDDRDGSSGRGSFYSNEEQEDGDGSRSYYSDEEGRGDSDGDGDGSRSFFSDEEGGSRRSRSRSTSQSRSRSPQSRYSDEEDGSRSYYSDEGDGSRRSRSRSRSPSPQSRYSDEEDGSRSYYSDEQDGSRRSRSSRSRSPLPRYSDEEDGSRSYYSDEQEGSRSRSHSRRSRYSDEEGGSSRQYSDEDRSRSYRSGGGEDDASRSFYSDNERSHSVNEDDASQSHRDRDSHRENDPSYDSRGGPAHDDDSPSVTSFAEEDQEAGEYDTHNNPHDDSDNDTQPHQEQNQIPREDIFVENEDLVSESDEGHDSASFGVDDNDPGPVADGDSFSRGSSSFVSRSSQGQQSGQLSFEEKDRSPIRRPTDEAFENNNSSKLDGSDSDSRSSRRSQFFGERDGEEDDERSYISDEERSVRSDEEKEEQSDESHSQQDAPSSNEGHRLDDEVSSSANSDDGSPAPAKKNTWWNLDTGGDETDALFDTLPQNDFPRKQDIASKQVTSSNDDAKESIGSKTADEKQDRGVNSSQNLSVQNDGFADAPFDTAFDADDTESIPFKSGDNSNREFGDNDNTFESGFEAENDIGFGSANFDVTSGESDTKQGNDQDLFANDPFNVSNKGGANDGFSNDDVDAFGSNDGFGDGDVFGETFPASKNKAFDGFGESEFATDQGDAGWNTGKDMYKDEGEGSEFLNGDKDKPDEDEFGSAGFGDDIDDFASQQSEKDETSDGSKETSEEEEEEEETNRSDAPSEASEPIDRIDGTEPETPLVSDDEDEQRPESDTDSRVEMPNQEQVDEKENLDHVEAPTDESDRQLSEEPLSEFYPISFSINVPDPELNTLIILCSMFPGSEEEASNQDQAMKLCKARGIIPHILMGQQKPSQRDELLQISRMEGFPQLFFYWEQTVSFVGDFEELMLIEEDGDLNRGLLERDPSKSGHSESGRDIGIDGDESKSVISETQDSEQGVQQDESVFRPAPDHSEEGERSPKVEDEEIPNENEDDMSQSMGEVSNEKDEDLSRSVSQKSEYSGSLEGSKSGSEGSRSSGGSISYSLAESRTLSLETSISRTIDTFSGTIDTFSDNGSAIPQPIDSQTIDTFSGTIDTFSDNGSEIPQPIHDQDGKRDEVATGHSSFGSTNEKDADESAGSGADRSDLEDQSERLRVDETGSQTDHSGEQDQSVRDDRSYTESEGDDRSYTESERDDRSYTESEREDRSYTESEGGDRSYTESGRDDRSYSESDGGERSVGSVDEHSVYSEESFDDTQEESSRSAPSFGESLETGNDDNEGTERSGIDSFRSEEPQKKEEENEEEQESPQSEKDSEGASPSQSQRSVSISMRMRSEGNKSGDSLESSMMIGDVFGQPNELFEDFQDRNNLSQVGEEEEESEESISLGEVASGDSADKDDEDTPSGQEEGSKNSESVHDEEEVVELSENENENEKELTKRPTVNRSKSSTKRRKKKRRRRRREAKSPALLDFAANVNEAMLDLEEMSEAQVAEIDDSSAYRLLHGFDALLGIFLQLSDELELKTTFLELKKKKKDKDKEDMVHIHALQAVLSFADTFDQLFADLMPIILDCFDEDPDEEMDDILYRLNSLVDLLCETTDRVGENQEWNERAETTYVTLLELMERDALDLRCIFQDVDTPDQGLSANIHEAWSATGHIEELRALQYAEDPWLFRQICYEVMVSTDQWCPDTSILMEICGIDPEMLEEEPDPEYLEEEDLAPIPQAAEHVLDKVNGDPLPRPEVMASILRRIIPPRAVTDATLLDHFTSIRNTLDNPLGLSATNIVSISSIAETLEDPESLGVGGMGKSTLAAMVAVHPDVRRWFIDGVVWVYVGDKELTYSRYTQCLRELVAQLDFYQGVPLFAELLHTPGEPMSKRRRREEGFMIYARDTIAELLHDRSVLIILDDVCFEPDLDWFDFAPMPGEEMDEEEMTCALLVTTRCRSLLPAADTVDVDMLDEADAISLLIQESGQLSHALMAESKEARSVVQECANHPLAVKSVGRWLNLKHATAGVVSSVEEIHAEVIKSMDKILKGGDHTGTDMMYEVLSLSLSPAINGEPTSIIKFCLAAFITVFCDREYISDFALTEPTPIIPMDMAELLFETLLEMNESSLLQKGSLFYAQKKEAAVLIPEALSALGVLKVITYSDAEDDEENPEDEQKFLQVMHFIHHEYGDYLAKEEVALQDLTKDAERQWNRALVEAYLSHVEEWDMDLEDAAHSYALEMIISHMIRGGMYSAAADLLADKSFVRGRLLSLGRENSTRRHIKDCETLFSKLKERRPRGSKLEPRNVMKQAYQALGSQLAIDDDDQSMEDSRIKDVEVARAHYEIGFSLSEKRCWSAAIAHWDTSQKLLESALGTVEVVAGILYNIGVVYSEMNEYEQALDSLKKCLRIRGTIHGEEHILYAQTIQKIGDTFLSMSDYHEAMESYNWALDVMYAEPTHHRVEIGEILDNKGTIHYSKGEIDEALQCHQEALKSKQVDLGEDHPELAATYHHIGNCLSDQGNVDDAIVHFEEAIRLKELDPEGGPERDADVLTIEGILHNLEGNQDQGLECYEKALQLLVTKVPHRKEKVASLLHLIGCVYLMSGEQKKAMKLFEESLQARRKVLGFVHLDVASTLFNMAFLHQTRNRLDRSLKCLEEALKIRQLRLPDSEKVAVTHEKIGSLARAIGKTKKAQIAFEEALRIRRLIHGEQNEAVATVLQELGDLMDDLGEYDSAMSYYIDALDIRRNTLGLDDIAVAETLYSMGYTLHNNDEPDRALVCFEESLSIRRYQLGEDSKEVGDTLNMMGFLKAKKGELDDAITLLWDALRIRKLQEDHVKVSETLKNIGNVHREKQEHELAVECYEECLRIRRSELGTDHEKVADALVAMGNVLSDMQQTDDAMRSYQEALKIRTLVFGEHDESVAAVLQYMGTMEFRAGNHVKARDLLTEFIRIRRDNGTKSDGDYVNVLFMIGNIHKMEGHEAEARLCWTEAYQVFQELGLAETNPQIAKVMNHLLKVENLEEQDADQKGKSVFAKVTEKFKKGGDPTKGRRRKKGKGGVALD